MKVNEVAHSELDIALNALRNHWNTAKLNWYLYHDLGFTADKCYIVFDHVSKLMEIYSGLEVY